MLDSSHEAVSPPPECAVDEPRASGLWAGLLALREFLGSSEALSTPAVSLCVRRGVWEFAPRLPDTADGMDACVALPLTAAADRDVRAGPPAVPTSVLASESTSGRFDPLGDRQGAAVPPFLRVYLPLVMAGFFAARAQRSFVIAHVAQTLDGRIACASGHSQWIGNEANLHHAHRLRALHDAVLVGGRTVERDDPQLTVRHVEGDDPARVVLNGSGSTLRDGKLFRLFASPGATVLCCDSVSLSHADEHRGVEVVAMRKGEDGAIAAHAVCAALAGRGHSSLFVEGGGHTLSRFLEEGCIDVLHVHVAPIILGSGIPSFSLPVVDKIDEGRRLRAEHYTMGGELMLVCRPERPPVDSDRR